jgi:hypothetical protein
MRYMIDEVKASYEPYKDSFHIQIYYRDLHKDNGNSKGGINMQLAMSTFDAYSTNDDVIMDMICKKSAVQTEAPYEFYDSMRYYIKDMASVGKNMFGMHTAKKYVVDPYYDQLGMPIATKKYTSDEVSFKSSGEIKKLPAKKISSSTNFVNQIDLLPGLSAKVKHPVTKSEGIIKDIIINLNDYHKWTREAVADWLETLDVDLRFKSPDDILREKQEKERQEQLDQLRTAMKAATDKIKKFTDEIVVLKESVEKFDTAIKQLLEEENGKD